MRPVLLCQEGGKMRKILGFLSILILLSLCIPASPVTAQSTAITIPPNCEQQALGTPGVDLQYILRCKPVAPVQWNGDWVVYAHGLVPPLPDPALAWLQLVTPDGTSLPGLINSLGYAFAASTYHRNGLAVQQGLEDTLALAANLRSTLAPGHHIYLVGASEGGLIATLAMERASAFDAAVAACGPIGDFRKEIDYLGDFRVLYDNFYPGVLPPTPVQIPQDLFNDWLQPLVTQGAVPSVYQGAVVQSIVNRPDLAGELINTSKASIDPADPASVVETAVRVLGYDVTEFNDVQSLLGLAPYSNRTTWYSGSSNDILLNRTVQRFGPRTAKEERALVAALAPYQTSGNLKKPLVTIHTTLDPEDPIWHQLLYRLKVFKQNKTSLYSGIPIARYGHCNFKAEELVFAFGLMVYKTTGQPFSLPQINQALPSATSREAFDALQKGFDGNQ
jgi:hypothetical protein